MQTGRRYDPTKDAKFHVSIVATEEIRRQWDMPRAKWTGPTLTVLHGREPRQVDCPPITHAVHHEDPAPQRAAGFRKYAVGMAVSHYSRGRLRFKKTVRKGCGKAVSAVVGLSGNDPIILCE